MLVPVEPLRTHIEMIRHETGISWNQLALLLWGPRSAGSSGYHGDTSRLKRQLGLIPQGGARSSLMVNKQIQYHILLDYVNKLDIDPIDVGL